MTLSDIMDLRGVLEQAFAAGANALQLDSFTRENSVEFQKDTPRVEITVSIGTATGAKRGFPGAQIIRFSRWNFIVKFEVFSRPNPQNQALHSTLVADLRAYASSAAQESWSDLVNFPNHFIAECLRDTGSPSELKPQEGYEQTAMTFTGVVGVRESAWGVLFPAILVDPLLDVVVDPQRNPIEAL